MVGEVAGGAEGVSVAGLGNGILNRYHSCYQVTTEIAESLILSGGGQRGIRTLGTLSRTHAFQACPFDRSGICPYQPRSGTGTVGGTGQGSK